MIWSVLLHGWPQAKQVKGAPPIGVGAGAFQFPVLGAERFCAGRSFADGVGKALMWHSTTS